ncbi:hypothetical protein KRMM14A1004_50940 [Krasilnikovia sp. MM14-A1004]
MVGAGRRLATELVVISASATQEMYAVVGTAAALVLACAFARLAGRPAAAAPIALIASPLSLTALRWFEGNSD